MKKTPSLIDVLPQHGVCHTLEETGRLMGITRERVRQIEKKALEKLRKRLAARGYKSISDLL